MKLQILFSITLLVASTQGLFLKTAAIKAKLPIIQSAASGLGSTFSGTIQTESVAPVAETVRIVRRYEKVAVPTTVYYEAPVYYREVREVPIARRTVYVGARATGLADIKSSLTGLIAGSARAVGGLGSTIKEAAANLLGSSGSASAGFYYSSI